jgi:hypothetical protein
MSKTIRCLVHKHNYKHDTSFGNRLYYWSQSFLITARTKFEYNVVVQREFWPELIFLHLPNTLSKSIHSFLDVEDGGGRCSLISPNEAEEIIKHGFQSFQHENHWFLEPHTNANVYSCIVDDPEYSPNLILSRLFDSVFKSIQFKHKEINDFFENTFKDHVGIHIRRLHGIHLSEGDIQDLPEYLREDYLKEYRPGDKYYPYIKDEEYFKIIDKILEHNPNQKFYLSTDLPPKYYQHYFEKYKNIFEVSSYREELISILDKYYSKDLVEKTDYIISYLLDFFALSHSKLIIRPYKRTSWSKTAQKIKGTQSIILFRGKIARKYVENNNFKIIEEIFNVDS